VSPEDEPDYEEIIEKTRAMKEKRCSRCKENEISLDNPSHFYFEPNKMWFDWELCVECKKEIACPPK